MEGYSIEFHRIDIEFNDTADCTLADRTEAVGCICVHSAVWGRAVHSFGLIAGTF